MMDPAILFYSVATPPPSLLVAPAFRLAAFDFAHARPLPSEAVVEADVSINPHHSVTTASASISTSISGETNPVTSTIVHAGRIFPNTSPCARPTFSHSLMSLTKIRVRTTCSIFAPAFSSATSIFFNVCTVCARASPFPTISPFASVAVVPETHTCAPTRTAREYPTTGSHGAPLAIFFLSIRNLHQRNFHHRKFYTPRIWTSPRKIRNLTPCSICEDWRLRKARLFTLSVLREGQPRRSGFVRARLQPCR